MKFLQKHTGRILIIRTIAAISLIVCFAFGYYFGENFPWKEQEPLYAMFRNVALILLGVLGAWFAVIFPFAYNAENPANAQTKRFIEILCPALDHAIYLLILTLIVPFCATIAKNFTYLMSAQAIFILRKASLAFLCLLLLYQIVVLLLILRPFDRLKSAVKFQAAADEVKKSYTPQKHYPTSPPE
jgi:hypothetical protein